MPSQLVHFEIPALDVERAQAFWGPLMGWDFAPWDGTHDYHFIVTYTEPDGAMYPIASPQELHAGRHAHDTRGIFAYFGVDDIDAALEQVVELGGVVTQPKLPLPRIGWIAHCADTEGNPFSLFQADDPVPAPGGPSRGSPATPDGT